MKPYMGLKTWKHHDSKGKILKGDVSVAKNYLSEKEISELNRVEDYNCFTDILSACLEGKDYTIPSKVIQLKKGCKTRIAGTLGKIHFQLSNVDVFKSDTAYFEIVKSLSPFAPYSNEKLYKDLSRDRKDY